MLVNYEVGNKYGFHDDKETRFEWSSDWTEM